MSKYIHHLTLRVAWHDSRWNGRVCMSPSKNPFCVALDRIREERDDEAEDKIAGKGFWEIKSEQHPPCKAESGFFMSEQEWYRRLKHPYQTNTKAQDTHGHLSPINVKISPYSAIAVPFAWMLKNTQKQIEESLPYQLPEDEKPPFPTPWVFGRARQEALLGLFFDKLTPERSLVFFYTKEGHPLDEKFPRLIVGAGIINKVGKLLRYDSSKEKSKAYSPWDRVITHSIRPDSNMGFLLPYHDYLESTGDSVEDEKRFKLLNEIAVPADLAHIKDFSYAAELASPDVTLSTLVSLLSSVRKIRQHGIAKGPWEEREEWVNNQISFAWKDRGAFPGVGSALEALGMRLGTSLFLDLLSSEKLSTDDDPWPLVDAVLRGDEDPPRPDYKVDIEAVRNTWTNLDDKRRTLLKLLSRFDLSIPQAKRWFNTKKRNKATRYKITDSQIIENPYTMVETDLGDQEDSPVSLGAIDRGLMPESTIVANHPVPKPSFVGSPNDPRRVRSALASVLQYAATQGDSLLSQVESLEKLEELPLAQELMIGDDWIEANQDALVGVIENLKVFVDPKEDKKIPALQLKPYKDREDYLRKILNARAKKKLPSLEVDWKELLQKSIEEAGGKIEPGNYRHSQALSEQAEALEIITTRKMSVLVGRAGTGKTSVMGALLKVSQIYAEEGVLLLAPTGKARVRLSKATQAEALTIAQFLYRCKRYDGVRQRPLFEGGEPYRKQKNVIIDECSMLTMDDLVAVLKALDLGHVNRIIMVGDPNQLPPIGVGRPFADFAGYLDNAKDSDDERIVLLSAALARLTIELRSSEGAPSDTLRLASWFTREPQPVDGDRVLSELELGQEFNDLEICYWNSPEELHEKILEQFHKSLGIKNQEDIEGFNNALGLNEKGWVPYENPNGVENFQILSPVRMHLHGVYELNRWIQMTFRKNELIKARQPWGDSLGDEEIVIRDKVIQVNNQNREGYDNENREEIKKYIANGEIGIVARSKNKWFNVIFADRPYLTFGYSNWKDFKGGAGPLELAYALTIHKSQGSEFQKVFVVMPRETRLLSRELLYTALTRAKDKLILLIEGNDPTFLYEHSKSERSNTANRNTNLFAGAIREETNAVPYSHHLIHKTLKGHMVRSKSELVISNILFENGIEYHYERVLEGKIDQRKLRPDFTFIDPSGELIIWEHLGMLAREDYRVGWEWKKNWYSQNGFTINDNLFTSEDDLKGGLDAVKVKDTALKIKQII
jgi:ATP-dependent exoDNAse (exonuclease V) alpha subunit